MPGPVDDRLIARVAEELRRPVPARADFDARVMAAVRRAPPSRPARAWTWLREPKAVALSPLGGLAMAAGIAALAIVGALSALRGPGAGGAAGAAARAAASRAVVTFVLLAPDARSVALAGDFDGWDRTRMPMRRETSGLWTLVVPLAPGRYQYAFVVDGQRFVADPAAPRALGDDFGQPTSVVTVAGRGGTRAAGGSL